MFDKSQLASLMKKAQDMQEQLEKTQKELDKLEVIGESGAGLVKITMSCKHEARKMTIDSSIINANESDMLEDLIVAAINDANRKIIDTTSKKMGSMKIPGMPDLKLPF